MTKTVICPECHGHGFITHHEYSDTSIHVWSETCPSCNRSGVVEVEPTNANNIRTMPDEKLADFLLSLAYDGETPWTKSFYEKFCKNCPPLIGYMEGRDEPSTFFECDFVDGKCPHGSDIEWWLKQPMEG